MSHCCRLRTVPVLLALLAAALCATALVSGSAAAERPASAPGSVIRIAAYAFHPVVLTVARGTTVLWVNKDDDVHTIRSQDGPEKFQSPALDSGGRYGFTFRRAGTYHYICSVHPYMHGVIIVR
jgi:plastocyanin